MYVCMYVCMYVWNHQGFFIGTVSIDLPYGTLLNQVLLKIVYWNLMYRKMNFGS